MADPAIVLRNLRTHQPFTGPATMTAWRERAAALRIRARIALGLWPEPARSPLDPWISRCGEVDGVIIEEFRFASLPGCHVTGNLYRPARGGCGAAVLSPHGHRRDGRFGIHDAAEMAAQLAAGGEICPDRGRNPVQARCMHLARLGCIVLQPDMVGYGASRQIPLDAAHFVSEPRPQLDAPERWGLHGSRAEGHLLSVMGLQAWNSIRSLDLLCALPDVDPSRIGVTGESGGGTQTLVLGALDERPAAFFPAAMVSTRMQGGCICENSSLLRLDAGNVELAGLIAPRPLGLTTADDWTHGMPEDGFPGLLRLYTVHEAGSNVELHHFPHHPHGFNHQARAAMYGFFNRHLRLGREADELIEGCGRSLSLPAPRMEHEQPAGELAVLGAWRRAIAERLDAEPALRHAGCQQLLALAGDGVPPAMTLLRPPLHATRRGTVLWLEPEAAEARQDDPPAATSSLTARGLTVALLRLRHEPNRPADGTPDLPAFTLCYNRPQFLRRLADALAAVQLFASEGPVLLAGFAEAGRLAAALRVAAGQRLAGVVLDAATPPFAAIVDWHDPGLLPGALRYGDLPGLLACPGAPWRLAADREDAAGWLCSHVAT